MNSSKLDFQGFIKKLEPYQQIALTAPAGADGDSVGTQCSLAEILSEIYPKKKIRIVNEEPCPKRYQFLKGSETFEVSKDILNSPRENWPDIMICVDGGANRVGDDTEKLWRASKSRAQVDHHAIGGATSDYDFRLYDPKSASTTLIIYHLVKTLGLKLSKTIAQAIYVGIIFDTGLFKHSNTSPDTMRIGADLLETGFDHTSTVERALLMRSVGAFKMLQSVLAKVHFDLEGRYVWGVLSHQDFLAAGGDPDDREGIIDQLFLTEKCEIAAFYFERRPEQWKISFRSRGHDVAKLAQSLNTFGGGHVQAAGCSLEGSEATILKQCHLAIKKQIDV